MAPNKRQPPPANEKVLGRLVKNILIMNSKEVDAILSSYAAPKGPPQEVNIDGRQMSLLKLVTIKHQKFSFPQLSLLRFIDQNWTALSGWFVMHAPGDAIAQQAALEEVRSDRAPRTPQEFSETLEILIRRGVDINAKSDPLTHSSNTLSELLSPWRDPNRSAPELLAEVDVLLSAGFDLEKFGGYIVCDLLQSHHKNKDLWDGLLDRGLSCQPGAPASNWSRWRPEDPITTAINLGRPDALRRILTHPALKPALNPLWSDAKTGNNFLGVAALVGTTTAAKAFLEIPVSAHPSMGAHTNKAGDSMLHLAAASCQPLLVQRALDTGGDVNAFNAKGLRPVEMIRRTSVRNEKSMSAILALLTPTAPAASNNDRVATVTAMLHVAVRARAPDAVVKAIQDGADVHATDSAGLNAMQLAARSVRSANRSSAVLAMKVMDLLLDAGADLNAITADFISSALCSPARTKLLTWGASNGMDGNRPGEDGWPGFFDTNYSQVNDRNHAKPWVDAIHILAGIADLDWHVHPNRQSGFMATLDLDLVEMAAEVASIINDADHPGQRPSKLWMSALDDKQSDIQVLRDRLVSARLLMNPDDRALELMDISFDAINQSSEPAGTRRTRIPLVGLLESGTIPLEELDSVKAALRMGVEKAILRRIVGSESETTRRPVRSM